MTALAPRVAVYALARTQLDWIPKPSRQEAATAGFVHGRGKHTETCPDCLANDFTHTFGCETCGGSGEIPGSASDRMDDPLKHPPADARRKTYWGGTAGEEARDRARAIDGQISRLEQLARARNDDPDALPEDWLSRAVRIKEAQWRTGDYGLLEEAQGRLALAWPARHYAWWRFIVEHQDLTVDAEAVARFDDTADWLAGRILLAIHAHMLAHRFGIERRRRPDHIVVPPEHQAEPDATGKGRWANGHAQGQRNALIVAMSAEGKTAGEIGRRVGLDKRRVQQILASVNVATATGPAA